MARKPRKPRVAPVETVPRLSMANVSARESSPYMTFVVRMDRAATKHVAFDYRTIGGTATAGVDFAPVSGTKIVPPGAVSTTIDVPILSDTQKEGAEVLSVALSNPRFV